MKKILLSFFVLALTVGANSQSITESFDAYTAGMYVAEQNPLVWTTWSGAVGGGEDAMVSTAQANSGANSILLEDGDTDLVLPLGDLESGAYDLSMKCYVPAGTGGYFNVLHHFVTDEWEWAIDIFFNGDGTGSNIAAGTEEDITYPEDQWFDVVFFIDLDNDNATFTVDGNLFRTWQWSLNGGDGAPGMNKLAALDIYPAAVPGAMFYIDDITFGFADAITEVATPVDFTISPNPATDNVTVTLNNVSKATTITLFDITGKVVYTETTTGIQSTVVDLNNISEGVYMLEVLSGNERQTKRLIVSK